jgi:hypothetical protein
MSIIHIFILQSIISEPIHHVFPVHILNLDGCVPKDMRRRWLLIASLQYVFQGVSSSANAQGLNLQNGREQYEAQFEGSSICYTYITTIAVTAQSDKHATAQYRQSTTAARSGGDNTGMYQGLSRCLI